MSQSPVNETDSSGAAEGAKLLGVPVPEAINSRIPIFDFLSYLASKPVPANLGWDFCMGSVCMLLMVNQFVTGALLTIYYRPTLGEAYESVQYIQEEIHFGWLVRQLHAWGANLMILALVIHMARVIYWASYKKPRELNWFVGLGLLGLTLTMGFTGYLLPWDQLAYWASKVGTEIPGSLPVIGPWIMHLMRGGDEISGATLGRFFSLHVMWLPAIMAGLVGLHLTLMRMHGISGYPDSDRVKKVPFFPNHVAKDMVLIFGVLALLYALVVVSPWELHDKADPLVTPEKVKPEWYFLWTYQLLKYFPTQVGPISGKLLGLFVSGGIGGLIALLPFIDRGPEREPRKRRAVLGMVAGITVLIVGLTILGFLCENTYNVLGVKLHFDIRGIPSF